MLLLPVKCLLLLTYLHRSVITPAAPNVKISSPAANNYLDGITNVAEALTQGGILVGESGAGDGSDSLSIVIKGVDGSLTNVQKNPINTAVGQGELVNAGTSLVGQALSTATSPSNVGALNTTKPTAGSVESHSDGCGCSICGCAHSTPAPSLANSPSGKANITSPPILRPTGSTMAMPMTSCGGAPTVTETWHSTHYAETATMFSFMSIMTVTCTETIRYVLYLFLTQKFEIDQLFSQPVPFESISSAKQYDSTAIHRFDSMYEWGLCPEEGRMSDNDDE